MALFQGELANRDTLGERQIGLVTPLDRPSGGGKQLIDLDSRFLLGRHRSSHILAGGVKTPLETGL